MTAFKLLPIFLLTLLSSVSLRSAETMKTNSAPVSTNELATLGGGCFWCLEALFETLPGVKAVTSGYAGGAKTNPTYKEVCSGHAASHRPYDKAERAHAIPLGL